MTKGLLGISAVNLFGEIMEEITINTPVQATGNRSGPTSLLERQLSVDENGEKPAFARIYGFSFEGSYYQLPHAILFLVHGGGELVTVKDDGQPHPSRAPRQPDVSGVGAADFDLSDDIRFWTYDCEDISMRMDVETGRLQEILLEPFIGGGDFGVSGMNARGMNARGMNARGMNARGMNARGMNARGGGSD